MELNSILVISFLSIIFVSIIYFLFKKVFYFKRSEFEFKKEDKLVNSNVRRLSVKNSKIQTLTKQNKDNNLKTASGEVLSVADGLESSSKESSFDLSKEEAQYLKKLVESEDTGEAIKFLRDITGESLMDCKAMIEKVCRTHNIKF